MATLSAALAAKTVGISKGGCPPLEQGSKGRSPSPLFSTFGVEKTAPPQTHQVSGRGRNVLDEGIKRAVSQRVWRRGDSGTANIAALEDSTTRAAKDGPVWCHCSALAVRYKGKCGADSARASHSENEPSMKGLRGVTSTTLGDLISHQKVSLHL